MRIEVQKPGWRLWDYDAREYQLVAPPGTHEVRQEPIAHLNHRTAIVFAHPETIGGNPHDRAGEDEEYLRQRIALGTANVSLLDG